MVRKHGIILIPIEIWKLSLHTRRVVWNASLVDVKPRS